MSKNGVRKIGIVSFVVLVCVFAMCLIGAGIENISTQGRFGDQTGSSTLSSADQVMYVVTIKYMYANGTLADSKDVYTYADGDTISLTIPQINGYTSSINEIYEEIDSDFLDRVGALEYVDVSKQEDYNIYRIYYTVTYNPAPSEYTVVHYLQNLDGTYTVAQEETIDDNVYIGDTVSCEALEFEGYTYNDAISIDESTIAIDEDTVLSMYYDRNEYYIYIADSGDTYLEPITMLYGQTVSDLSTPTRQGYEFNGWTWAEEQDGDAIDKPDTMPANNLYATGNWTPVTTTYTLAYYTENADDTDYTNIGNVVISNVTTEDLVSDYLTENIIESNFQSINSEYMYFTYDSATTLAANNDFDVEIAGDGTTIINIYYSRNYYTLTFDLNDSSYSTKATMVVDGVSYTSSNQYSFTAKYNQNIATLWPTAANFADAGGNFAVNGRNTYYLYGWTTTFTSTVYVSSRITLTDGLISDSTANSTTTYTAYYTTSSSKQTLYYMVESFDQTTTTTSTTRVLYNNVYYDAMDDYTNTVYSSSTNWSAKEIQGLTNVGQSSSSSTYYFYYSRNEYTVTFYNVNQVQEAVTMVYGQSMEDIASTVGSGYPIDVTDKESYIFDNWYYDSTCTMEMDWTDDDGEYKTISDDLTLYANYIAPTYTVSFNTNDGDWTDTSSIYEYIDGLYTIEVESATTIERPSDPEKEGYTFKGWYYTNSNGDYIEYIFSDSQKVYGNLELEAVWEAKTDGQYTVKYILAEYDSDGNLITDLSQYVNIQYVADDKIVTGVKYGTIVTEEAIYVKINEVDMYLVDGYKKSITISTDNDENVIYFLYTQEQSVSYTVYYLLDNGTRYVSGDVPDESEYLSEPKVVELDDMDTMEITESSIEIDGYEVDAYQKSTYLIADTQNLDATQNAVYFYYSLVERQGDYEVNFYFMDEDGNYPDSPDYTASGQASVGMYIKAEDYADYLSLDSPLYEDHEYDAEKSDVVMVVVSSGETAVLNLYFKMVSYTVTYDTQGGTWQDTDTDTYTNIDEDIYQTEVYYQKTAPEPVQPSKDGYRFDGWYDTLTDEEYDFDTPVTDDVSLYAKWVEVKSITVTKVWDDNDNQDGKRVDPLTIYVKADGTVVGEYTVTETDGWKITIDTLDVYDENGKEIVYSIEEEALADYSVEYSNVGDSFTITNTHEIEKTYITAQKVWDDNSNQDGMRPDEVTLHLLANGVEVGKVTLNDTIGWDYTWQNLDKYSDGKLITYTIEEDEIANYSYATEFTDDTTILVTNTHIPETTDKTVTKIWRDGSNKDDSRPDSIQIMLYKNGEPYSEAVTLTAANSNGNYDEWEYTFKDLDVYEDGEEITYTVKEVEVPDGYGVIYKQSKLYIYNAYPPEVEISAKKVWDDEDDADGIRDESVKVVLLANGEPYEIDGIDLSTAVLDKDNDWTYTWEFAEKYDENGDRIEYTLQEVTTSNTNYTTSIDIVDDDNPEFQFTYQITNSYVPQKTTRTVTKVWEDNDDQDGIRPESTTIYLYADGEEVDSVELNEKNDWTYTFENINVNKKGEPIVYTISEDNVEGYYKEIVDNGDNTFTVTNTHVPETTSINIEKEWDDNDDQDGIRLDTISVDILANGEYLQTVTLTKDDEYKLTVDGLDVYQKGQVITYTLKEEEITGYSADYEYNGYNLKITNTHEPETRDITVKKVWEDDENRDNIREDEITFDLAADGTTILEKISVAKDENFETVVQGLDKYRDGGVEIIYTVEENTPSEYIATYAYDLDNNLITITNTHAVYTTSVTITKVWDDMGNTFLNRPDSVEVYLYADDEYLQTVTLEEAYNYTQTISGLYLNDSGKEIVYTVKEKEDASYEVNITDSDGTFTVTNSLITYDIMTEVNGTGGTISGQDASVYETVSYNTSNTKDIVVTPNEGYYISKITINDVEQILPEDTQSEYILPTIENITEDKTVVVEFARIPFEITTDVVSGQGTISGDGDTPYETVYYGDSSTKEIVITPDYGWEISKITINGTEQTLPQEVREEYTLGTFEDVKIDILVEVEFVQTEAKVIVSYVDQDGNTLTDDVEIDGYIGDAYQTEEKPFENYFLTETTENLSGTMDEEVTYVVYTYEYRPNIYVTNTLKGTAADITKDFCYEVLLNDESGNPYTGDVEYSITDEDGNVVASGTIQNGTLNISINHLQTLTLQNVPIYTNYSVTQQNGEEYTTTIDDELTETRNISDTLLDNTTINYINEKEFITPTGVVMTIAPFVIGIVIVYYAYVALKNKKMRKVYKRKAVRR